MGSGTSTCSSRRSPGPARRWTYEPDVSIAALGASYAYGLVQNHPYVDGNKRVGLIVLGAFLCATASD